MVAFSIIAFIPLEKGAASPVNVKPHSAPTLAFRAPLDTWTLPTLPTVTAPISIPVNFDDSTIATPQLVLANNDTRAEIYDYILANPGAAFRDICAGLNLAIGTAEFHLGVLKKAGLISFLRDGKYKRFFASRVFSQKEMQLLSLLRHSTVRSIIEKLTAEKAVNHGDLASRLCITSQGLTWQMSRLRQEGIVSETCEGLRVTYRINERYGAVLPQLLSRFEQ